MTTLTTALKLFLLALLALPYAGASASLKPTDSTCASALDSKVPLLKSLLQMAIADKLITLQQLKKCQTPMDLAKLVAAQPNEVETMALAEALANTTLEFKKEDTATFAAALNSVVSELENEHKESLLANKDTEGIFEPHLVQSREMIPGGIIPYLTFLDNKGNPYAIGQLRPRNAKPVGHMEFEVDRTKPTPAYLYTLKEEKKVFDDTKGMRFGSFEPSQNGSTVLVGQYYANDSLHNFNIELKDGRILDVSNFVPNTEAEAQGKKLYKLNFTDIGSPISYKSISIENGFAKIQIYDRRTNTDIGKPVLIKNSDEIKETFNWVEAPKSENGIHFAIQIEDEIILYQMSATGEFLPTVVPYTFSRYKNSFGDLDPGSSARILSWGPDGHAVISHKTKNKQIIFYNGKDKSVTHLYEDLRSGSSVRKSAFYKAPGQNTLLVYFDEKYRLNVLDVDFNNKAVATVKDAEPFETDGEMVFTGEGYNLKLHFLSELGDYLEFQFYRVPTSAGKSEGSR